MEPENKYELLYRMLDIIQLELQKFPEFDYLESEVTDVMDVIAYRYLNLRGSGKNVD